MAWLVNGKTIAKKVPNPTYGVSAPAESSNIQPWPGLPAGVKFNPSDQELLKHLEAKLGKSNRHPFLDTFISTLDSEDDICNIHPENLPGIKDDGTSIYYFHRPSWACATGKRKGRRQREGEDKFVSWHKIGKISISEYGKMIGFKQIMVFDDTKAGKTNWVMHQYYLGLQEEKEGEYVVSKIFSQTQTRKFGGVEGDNGESEKSSLEEAEGPDYLVQQLKTNEIMMDVSSPEVVLITDEAMADVSSTGEVLVPPFEMHLNLQHQASKTNVTMIDVSSSGEVLAQVFGGMHPPLQHKGFESSETMMDVSSPGEALAPLVLGEINPNLQFRTNETRKRVSSQREALTTPALGKMQANTQHKGLFQKMAEEVKAMLDTSFPQTVPAMGEQGKILLKEDAIGMKADIEQDRGLEIEFEMQITNFLERVELGTPPDELWSTQEVEEVVDEVVDKFNSMTDSQKLLDSFPD